MKKRIFILFILLYLVRSAGFGLGADAAYPALEKVLEQIPIAENTLYIFSDDELNQVLDTSADLVINLFELMDCLYRYLAPRNMRVEISGTSLRNARQIFDYGGHPIELLLPIGKIVKVELGAALDDTQQALDMYLDAPYSVYIDIATALYDTRCGFESVEPHIFSKPYGMHIKKWVMVKAVRKIHLYEALQAAAYIEGFYKPKIWHLRPIQKLS
ncbi:MAG: hypothetical protein P1P65_03715 [Treponema sp.]